jgi:hypothetical protein
MLSNRYFFISRGERVYTVLSNKAGISPQQFMLDGFIVEPDLAIIEVLSTASKKPRQCPTAAAKVAHKTICIPTLKTIGQGQEGFLAAVELRMTFCRATDTI